MIMGTNARTRSAHARIPAAARSQTQTNQRPQRARERGAIRFSHPTHPGTADRPADFVGTQKANNLYYTRCDYSQHTSYPGRRTRQVPTEPATGHSTLLARSVTKALCCNPHRGHTNPYQNLIQTTQTTEINTMFILPYLLYIFSQQITSIFILMTE